jgi:hypothetical protein
LSGSRYVEIHGAVTVEQRKDGALQLVTVK